MIHLLLLMGSLAQAQDDPGDADIVFQHGPWSGHLQAALGAQWAPVVGDEADVATFDALSVSSARITHSTLALELDGPAHSFAALRVGEGHVHAGGLESAEARVGVADPAGRGQVWVGRGDIPVTRDRASEPEQLILSFRPVLSRVMLPLHASGAGTWLAWPDRASVRLGVSYASLVSDAPYLWARLSLHPLGDLPALREAPVDGVRVELAGSVLRMDSESMGKATLLSSDMELRWGSGLLSASWVRYQTDRQRDEWIVSVGRRVVKLGDGDLHLHLRGERVTGLVEGEDVRWLGGGRLAWRAPEQRVVIYLESLLSREQGAGAASDEDVVVLARGVERANDIAAVGILLRI